MQVIEIIENVMEVLNRPDLRSQVEKRVRGAITWAHKSEYFVRDRQVSSQQVQTPDHLIRMTIPPYWRQFESIVPLDQDGNRLCLSTDDADHIGYREVDPRSILTVRGHRERNYYYVAGDVLNIETDARPYKIHFIYYAVPDVRSDNAVTWITEQYQELIQDRALGVMYSILGNQDLRNTYMNLAAEQLEMLRDNAFQAGAAQ